MSHNWIVKEERDFGIKLYIFTSERRKTLSFSRKEREIVASPKALPTKKNGLGFEFPINYIDKIWGKSKIILLLGKGVVNAECVTNKYPLSSLESE